MCQMVHLADQSADRWADWMAVHLVYQLAVQWVDYLVVYWVVLSAVPKVYRMVDK